VGVGKGEVSTMVRDDSGSLPKGGLSDPLGCVSKNPKENWNLSETVVEEVRSEHH